ncbi:MAG TPA: Uma2 family endonuclease [Polyangiaceae bacterium]
MGAARKMTVEQWGELDDHDHRELVDGVLEEAEMPAPIHDLVMFWLGSLLYPYFRKRGGFSFGEGPRLAVRRDRGRVPDVSCFVRDRRLGRESTVRTAPDIVIEIISPRPREARRDRIDKLADYAEMGAKQYWLVDPKLRTFEILQLGAKRKYTTVIAASSGKLRRIPTFPGLVIDIDDLWSEVDRYERTME